MNSERNLISISIEKNIEKQEDISFFASFDLITLKIIQKFYGNDLNPINGDLNSYCIQQLHQALNREGVRLSLEGLRKKINFLVKIGILEKVDTYPRIYMPLKDIEGIKKIQSILEKLKQFLLL